MYQVERRVLKIGRHSRYVQAKWNHVRLQCHLTIVPK